MHIINSSFKNIFQILSTNKDGKFLRPQFLFTQRFNEYLFQCFFRYQKLIEIENEILKITPQKIKRPLQEIQLSFVNELEVFFEEIYSTLSAFSVLLIGTTFKDYIPQKVSKNNENLLNFLENFIKDDTYLKNIQTLREAKIFRNNVVHFKKDLQQDWMTFSYLSPFGQECVVIYYFAKGPEVYYRGFQDDPYAANFMPPVNYSSFYVSPSHKKIFKALNEVIFMTLRKITEDEKSRPNENGVDLASVDAQFGVLPRRLYGQQNLIKSSLWSNVKNYFLRKFGIDVHKKHREGAVVQKIFRHK